MSTSFETQFPVLPPTEDAVALRIEVRQFLRSHLKDRSPVKRAESWEGFDADFSRAVGDQGWIGMCWPKEYGGRERSALERYVVVEEMLAAGAPVAAHWFADRQSGPTILRYGTEAQKREILPRIARGECYFAVGMSEPDSGSDLASARTRATETADGFVLNGTKLWTSIAHRAHYMIAYCRTDGHDDRHGGTSQFLVDLSTPGIDIRPVLMLTGEHHFNEVVLRDVHVPRDALLGKRGDGWSQVMGELSFERSGPERFLSSFTVLVELLRRLGSDPNSHACSVIGRIAARMAVFRRMSRSIAGKLQAGEDPSLEAAIVKDIGAVLEQEIPEFARLLVSVEPDPQSLEGLESALAYTLQHAPSFSLRGGTREILRGIIARELGLR